ncbi:MAG: TonB-dependent receptor, partial [Balneolales bacterium]
SGIYDVKLRPGNNEKFESVFGFGLLGTDLTLEGPFKKGYGGSYLVNYRYSTITLIDEIGLVPELGGIPKFQDAAFKVTLPTQSMGTFSLFGLSGMSEVNFEDVTPDIWVTPGERGMSPNIREDFDKRAHLLNIGMNHILPLQSNSYIQTTLAYSNEGIRDRVFEVLLDDEEATDLNFSSRIRKSAYRTSFTYNNKLNARNNIQAGTQYALYNYDYNQSQLREDSAERFLLTEFHEYVNTINNFVSWQYRMNERLTIVSGLHNANVLLNNKITIEPRIAVNWMVSPSGSVQAGYGMHSTMESIHHYFAKVEQEDGSVIETNKSLDLLKAHHFVLGYEQRFGSNFMGKVEFYYQDLYN